MRTYLRTREKGVKKQLYKESVYYLFLFDYGKHKKSYLLAVFFFLWDVLGDYQIIPIR